MLEQLMDSSFDSGGEEDIEEDPAFPLPTQSDEQGDSDIDCKPFKYEIDLNRTSQP